MKNGLNFFRKTSQRGSWNIAAYHNPHSLTWSWVLSLSLFRADEGRVRPLWWSYPTNQGRQWGFRIPYVGIVSWHRQQPMWFRDMYMRLRDETDTAAYHRSVARRELPRVVPINNSQALH